MLQVSCMLSHAFCRLNSRVSSLWVLLHFCGVCLWVIQCVNVGISPFLMFPPYFTFGGFFSGAMEHILYDLWKAMDITLSFRVGFFLSFVAQDLLWSFVSSFVISVPTFHRSHVSHFWLRLAEIRGKGTGLSIPANEISKKTNEQL